MGRGGMGSNWAFSVHQAVCLGFSLFHNARRRRSKAITLVQAAFPQQLYNPHKQCFCCILLMLEDAFPPVLLDWSFSLVLCFNKSFWWFIIIKGILGWFFLMVPSDGLIGGNGWWYLTLPTWHFPFAPHPNPHQNRRWPLVGSPQRSIWRVPGWRPLL